MPLEDKAAAVTRRSALPNWSFYGWLGAFFALYSIYPRSGMGPQSTVVWHDQALFLMALTDTIATGSSDLFAAGVVGPGYVSIARILHDLFRLGPDASLVLLAEISFVATGLVMLAFVYRLAGDMSAGSRAGLMAVVVLALFTSPWAFAADIPWTHFTETALLAVLVLLMKGRTQAVKQVLIGAVAVLAFQTRSYEGAVMAIALAIVAVGWLGVQIVTLHRLDLRWIARTTAFVILGVVIADGVIWATTRVAMPFVQYNGDAGAAKLLWSQLPIKAVQLFVDTCFSTICDSAATKQISILGFPDGLNVWWQPLSVQLPGLVAAATVVALLLAASASARRALLQPATLFAVLTAGGVLLAYTAAAPSGSPQLKYGFMRDYLAPMVLLVMAAAALAAAARAQVALCAIGCFVAVVAALMMLRPFAANTLPRYELAKVEYSAACGVVNCSFAVSVHNRLGHSITLSPATVFAEQCGDQLIQGVADLDRVTYDPRICSSIVLIPAVTGLAQTPNPERYLGEPVVTPSQR